MNTSPKAQSFADSARQAAFTAQKLAREAVAKAGDVTYTNRDKIDVALNKASGFVNQKTEAKYAKQVEKIKQMLRKGVDFIAKQRPGAKDDAQAAAQDYQQPPRPDTM